MVSGKPWTVDRCVHTSSIPDRVRLVFECLPAGKWAWGPPILKLKKLYITYDYNKELFGHPFRLQSSMR